MHPVVRRVRAAAAVGLAVTAIIVLTAVTPVGPVPSASAEPGTAAPSAPSALPPGALLVLTIHHGRSTQGRVLARVALTCDPDGGTHPHPAAACEALRQARGQFDKLPQATYLCPLYVDPVTGEAEGRWHGTPVHAVRFGSNRCTLARSTDSVFGF